MAPTLPHIEGGLETLEIILLKVCLLFSRKKNIAGYGRFDPGPHLKCSLDQSLICGCLASSAQVTSSVFISERLSARLLLAFIIGF